MAPTLPSFATLGSSWPSDVSPPTVASVWLESFASNVAAHNVPAILSQFIETAFWRDLLALTWDFRSFFGRPSIEALLRTRLELSKIVNVRLSTLASPTSRNMGTIGWVEAMFEFDTAAGNAVGVVRLVPTSGPGQWKALSLFTNLEGLHGVIEPVGAKRPTYAVVQGATWKSARAQESEYNDHDPTVLIVGAGHSGLGLAARLKYLGVEALLVDKEARVGQSWRDRYDSMTTHDIVWYAQMPYMPYPSGWPVYTPAAKLADWLENYASQLDLNVWTSTTILSAKWNETNANWSIRLRRGDGMLRDMTVNHLVWAGGWSGVPHVPSVPARETFKGQIIHSSEYKNAHPFVGKKVMVVGAGVSGHDIAQDLVTHGAESVTLHQRSSTVVISLPTFSAAIQQAYREDGLPVDIVDNSTQAFPYLVNNQIWKGAFQMLAKRDAALLEGLEARGFRTSAGPDSSGVFKLFLTTRGGYYLDVGASELIIQGKIKIKSGVEIESFTASGLRFGDGDEIPVDAVIFATGFEDVKVNLRALLDEELIARLKEPWGLTEEGEINAAWRDSGIPHFWYMLGNFPFSRFYSKRLALQIKAMELGVFGPRFGAEL